MRNESEGGLALPNFINEMLTANIAGQKETPRSENDITCA